MVHQWDAYKSKFSTPDLDGAIIAAVRQLGAERLNVLCCGFKDGQKKKAIQMLTNVENVGGA